VAIHRDANEDLPADILHFILTWVFLASFFDICTIIFYFFYYAGHRSISRLTYTRTSSGWSTKRPRNWGPQVAIVSYYIPNASARFSVTFPMLSKSRTPKLDFN
jgi:hypothetical protein